MKRYSSDSWILNGFELRVLTDRETIAATETDELTANEYQL